MRGLRVYRPNQVWSAKVTYLHPSDNAAQNSLSGGRLLIDRVMRSVIPRGVDWHTRKVLTWHISNSWKQNSVSIH
ncbi:hypothetical protein Z949_1932 [Sulfitobacter guttiformis KCTC 32187]|nr:hypothetical protein Z949_1932 [Sulfitobacter guttiformis KCTC 32187]